MSIKNLKVPSHPHTIRFPDHLYFKMRDEAKRTNRTFNGQVIHQLELGMALIARVRKIEEEQMEQLAHEIAEGEEDG